MRHILALILTILATPALAQTGNAPDLMSLIHADRWAEAQQIAQQATDPVVPKLVNYFRLMAPGAASFDEIVQFQADSPDWPLQASLSRRRDEALTALTDDTQTAADCDRAPPALPGAQLRCAEAYAHTGRQSDAIARANAAWATGESGIEARLLAEFATMLTPEAQWRRFERLTTSDATAAIKQIARLTPTDQPRATALLALRRDAPNAQALLDALSPEQRQQPALVLEQLRWLRRANRDDDALALWHSAGTDAESASAPRWRASFWEERNRMARQRLRQGDNDGAYFLANDTAQTEGEPQADAAFLAGFIALRKLNQPELAMTHFQRLASLSKAAITQGRAHYWMARAGGGAAEYEKAAAWPNTFYGQLALIALGQDPAERIRAQHDAAADSAQALELAGREVARAAGYLISWGESRRAQPFLFRLDDIAPDPADRALVARLATGLGAPEIAVALARRAGRDGLIQIETGWPLAAAIPPDIGIDPALSLGIIRQESSFDGSTVSPVGARGLMQLMPATATSVAKQLGTKAPVALLTTDPSLNIRLGTTYLHSLLDRFGGVVPFAVAGYNAGPSRVAEWNETNGDPRTGSADMIDWIELIPFGETRNYVQRVIENEVIYAARSNEGTAHPLAKFVRRAS
jgi:soluble lytic murein transglycosylase